MLALQGFRKKIGRYAAPYTGGSSAAGDGDGSGAMEARDSDGKQEQGEATPFECAVRRFEQQDRLLRRLDVDIGHMLLQIQTATATISGVAELFSETFSDDPESSSTGANYLTATKRIEREAAERMEQSIRFTVLDPLRVRLDRHDKLREQIRAHAKLSAACDGLRSVAEQLRVSRPEEDDKRVQSELRLNQLLVTLSDTEEKLLPLIEDVNQSRVAANALNLFNTMRLQVSIFFCHASQSLLADLSSTEMEIVSEASHPAKAAASAIQPPFSSASSSTTESKLSKISSLTSDGWTEVDGSSSSTSPDIDAIEGSEEEDEFRASSITLEDFEMGKSPPALLGLLDNVEVTAENTLKDTSDLLALASHPVGSLGTAIEEELAEIHGDQSTSIAPPRRLTTPSPRAAHFEPATPRRTASMFWSLRQSIRGKFSYQSGESRMIRQCSAPVEAVEFEDHLAAQPSREQNARRSARTPLAMDEWRAIETCLWEIDANLGKSPSKPCSGGDPAGCGEADLLSQLLLEKEELLFECISYLQVEDLVRFAKVNYRLHSCLVDCAPIWKKCIRSSGLARSVRSSMWLSVFYESTPWRSNGIASHHLSVERRRNMYGQLLAKVGAKLANGLVSEPSQAKDGDTQLLVWLREIDVDVVRTCHRDIYAQDVAKEWETTMSTASVTSSSAANSSNDEAVELILSEMIDSVVQRVGGDPNSSINACEPDTSAAPISVAMKRSLLEAKIRRVLRAYVVYNPRVGYCQGMGFLVRLLTEVAEDEADIFWLFVGFSEPENDRNLYEPGMAVLQPLLSKFELLFSTHMPELYAHFQAEGVYVATFCTRWFLTFFSSFETLGPTLVIRLLDIFVIDGWRIVFSMALVVLDELRDQLLRRDLEGILRVLQFPRNYMPEPDEQRQRQLLRHALAFSISHAINSI